MVMTMTAMLGVEKKEQAEADAEKLGGWDPRAAFISDTVRTIALLAHERLRPPTLRPLSVLRVHRMGATTPVSPWTDVLHACWFATTSSPFGFSAAGNWTTTNADFSTRTEQVWLVISAVPHRSFEFAELYGAGLFIWATVHGTLISRNGLSLGMSTPVRV